VIHPIAKSNVDKPPLVHFTPHQTQSTVNTKLSHITALANRPLGLHELNLLLLITSRAPNARPVKAVDFVFPRRVDVLPRRIGLERRLAILEVAPVVLRSNEGEDDNVDGHTSDKDSLNQGVVRNDLWPSWRLNRRCNVLSAS
jgi:hypothetical protein